MLSVVRSIPVRYHTPMAYISPLRNSSTERAQPVPVVIAHPCTVRPAPPDIDPSPDGSTLKPAPPPRNRMPLTQGDEAAREVDEIVIDTVPVVGDLAVLAVRFVVPAMGASAPVVGVALDAAVPGPPLPRLAGQSNEPPPATSTRAELQPFTHSAPTCWPTPTPLTRTAAFRACARCPALRKSLMASPRTWACPAEIREPVKLTC